MICCSRRFFSNISIGREKNLYKIGTCSRPKILFILLLLLCLIGISSDALKCVCFRYAMFNIRFEIIITLIFFIQIIIRKTNDWRRLESAAVLAMSIYIIVLVFISSRRVVTVIIY